MVSASGSTVRVDMLLPCTGPSRAPHSFVEDSPLLSAIVTKQGRIPVKDDFSLSASPNVFVVGDLCSHASLPDGGTAQFANWSGLQAAYALLQRGTWQRTRSLSALVPEPLFVLQDIRRWPRMYVISLGPHDGIVIVNGLVLGSSCLTRRMGGAGKWLIERTKVCESMGQEWALAFWALGDSAAALLGYIM